MLYGARTMQCLSCGGGLEFAGGGAHARCQRCCRLFSVQGGGLTPLQVQAPGGGDNPQFNAMYAQQLGFAPRQPEIPQQQQQYPQQPYPQQQQQYPQPPPQQQQGYDMPNIGVKMKYDGMPIEFSSQGGLNTDKLEKHFTKKVDQKISGCIWGLVIGGIIPGCGPRRVRRVLARRGQALPRAEALVPPQLTTALASRRIGARDQRK